MQTKKNTEKAKTLPEFEKGITEILVANGRSFQPFIRTFTYTGENVTKLSLGTLIGVFEVDERSEDSAYIVNFLASVAKKEYFNNPRRGAIESFEAALHKINLALAELVKHGNVSWLGKFHGAIGVLEKNNLHFSVTGDAKILLFRNNGIADISEGLASEESHIHPIKTFVEVSSGRLMLDDQIILSTPELFSLFSLSEIEKNACRMDEERFTQFLRTALRNELDMSGTLLIHIKEGTQTLIEKPEKKKLESPSITAISNVFSQTAFTPKAKEAPAEKEETLESAIQRSEEYIDSKTGHIYVQGDIPEEKESSPFFENVSLHLQEMGRSFRSSLISQGRLLRRLKKQVWLAFDSLGDQTMVATRKTYRSFRKLWKRSLSQKKPVIPEETPSTSFLPDTSSLTATPAPTEEKKERKISVSDIPVKLKTSLPSIEEPAVPAYPENTEEQEVTEASPSTVTETDFPPFLKEKLAKFYQKEISSSDSSSLSTETNVSRSLENVLEITSTQWQKILSVFSRFPRGFRIFASFLRECSVILWQNVSALYRKLDSFQKKVLLGSIFVLLIASGSGYYIFKKLTSLTTPPTSSTEQKSQTENSSSALPNEKNLLALDNPLTVAQSGDTIVAAILLDSENYIVTKQRIVNTSSNASFPLPDGNTARLATAMDDLRLIFILTENNRLFAWSPINHSFAENNLPLPSGTKIESIGTFLTYLYVLDSTNDQIYRFPRAEGGFGQSSSWLRDSVALEEGSKLAVNETLFLSSIPSMVQGFFRGRQSVTVESPNTPLTVTDLFTHPGLANVYALDTTNKRVLVWNQEGRLLTQYSHEKFGEGKTLTINERTNEILLVTQGNTLLSFKMK